VVTVCAPGFDSVNDPRTRPSAFPAAFVDPMIGVLCGSKTLVNNMGFLQQRWHESRLDFCTAPETCICHGMRLETKFLRLKTPVTVGSRFGEWRVCWLGGWTDILTLQKRSRETK
jgi:hypothetical protein